MKDIFNIKEVKEIERLEGEYDVEKASLLERKLRLLQDEKPELKPLRDKLRQLISDYESKNWSDLGMISDAQIEESDKAEELVKTEQIFLNKRKEIIRKKLKAYDMTQQDLGVLLNHPKSYMSELMSGVSQFTIKDLVIIHRVFGITLKVLIPTYLQSETRNKVRESIIKLNKPKIRFKKSEFV